MNNVEQAEFSLKLFVLLLSIGLVISTSIWVAYDAKAKHIPTTNKPYSINNGALAFSIPMSQTEFYRKPPGSTEFSKEDSEHKNGHAEKSRMSSGETKILPL